MTDHGVANLDPDTSSGATPTDYQSAALCAPGVFPIIDTDATYYSGYQTDFRRIRLLSPAPDGILEYLSTTAAGTFSVGVNNQNTQWLSLLIAPGTTLDKSNADFQSVLRSAQWHNDALILTPGIRTVEVIAFGAGGRSDTAYAYLNVPYIPSAGADTTFTVCVGTSPFLLASALADLGGMWSPTLPNGVFSPAMPLSGAYQYEIGNGVCPADTAWVAVIVLPLPVFSLGQDTSLRGAQFPLSLQAPRPFVWSDGRVASSFPAAQAGPFWSEYNDGAGCVFRDSVWLNTLATSSGVETIQTCFGQSDTWNGQYFARDTTVSAVFSGLNACDSTYYLTLIFSIPRFIWIPFFVVDRC